MKKYIIGGGLLAILLVVGLLGTKTSFASMLFIGQSARTSAATSSPVQLFPAGAVTTVIYDAYEANGTNQVNNGDHRIPQGVAVLVQLTGSSTATQLNMDVEYSQDNIDWFKPVAASTSPSLSLDVENTYTLLAVGDKEGGATGTGSSTRRMFTLDTPTRYVRVISSIPTGTATGTVWMQIVPLKETE